MFFLNLTSQKNDNTLGLSLLGKFPWFEREMLILAMLNQILNEQEKTFNFSHQ
jgi:hypothetical protein